MYGLRLISGQIGVIAQVGQLGGIGRVAVGADPLRLHAAIPDVAVHVVGEGRRREDQQRHAAAVIARNPAADDRRQCPAPSGARPTSWPPHSRMNATQKAARKPTVCWRRSCSRQAYTVRQQRNQAEKPGLEYARIQRRPVAGTGRHPVPRA